jgi:hypothetical protein
MTDKEWGKLWNYAEKQNVLLKIIEFSDEGYYKKEEFAVGEIIFCKNGSIRCDSCNECLAENRTAQQMKAIIKNLIEEVEV